MAAEWFGKKGVAQLAAAQQNSIQGRSATVNTMLGAYKQFDDVEFLLKVIAAIAPQDADVPMITAIAERHEKYRIAMGNEVIPVRS